MKSPNDFPHGGETWNKQQVIIARPCSFRGIAVTNKSAALFYVWICDSASDGADKPTKVLAVGPGQTGGSDWSQSPRTMLNGIYVCATTDPLTKTLIAAPDAFFEVAYELIQIDNPEPAVS